MKLSSKKTRVVHTVFLGRHFVYCVTETLKYENKCLFQNTLKIE